MSQVNLLAIDIAKPSENKGSKGDVGQGETNNSSDFSLYMAQQKQENQASKQNESGNAVPKKTVKSGNVAEQQAQTEQENKASSAKDIENEAPEKHASNEHSDGEKNAEPQQTTKEQAQATEAPEKTENSHYQPATNELLTEDEASALLDFIKASDQLKIKHQVDKAAEATPQTEQQSNKTIEGESQGKSSNAAISSGEQTEKVNTAKQINAEFTSKQESEAKKAPKEQVGQNEATLIKAVVADDQTPIEQENKSFDDKQLAEKLTSKTEQTTSNTAVKFSEMAQQVKAGNEQGQETPLPEKEAIIVDEDVLPQQTVKHNESAKKENGMESVTQNSLPKVELNTQTQSENKVAVEASTIKPEVLASQHMSRENKAQVQNAPSDRIINQATTEVVKNAGTAQQQTHDQGSGEPNAKEQQDSKQVPDVAVKQAFNEQRSAFTMDTKAPVIAESSSSQPVSQPLSTAASEAIQHLAARTNSELTTNQIQRAAQEVPQATINIYQKNFSNEVKEKVMVMINQRIKQLEIRLDPPELGSMQVKLNLQNEQAAVQFVVQNQQAKDAIEQNLSKLRDMLAQSGVDVGDANIEQRDAQGEQQQFADSDHRHLSDEEHATEEVVAKNVANLYKASSTGIDYYA